jgi:hypothetical protein
MPFVKIAESRGLYYLDFCDKYLNSPRDRDSLRLFCRNWLRRGSLLSRRSGLQIAFCYDVVAELASNAGGEDDVRRSDMRPGCCQVCDLKIQSVCFVNLCSMGRMMLAT